MRSGVLVAAIGFARMDDDRDRRVANAKAVDPAPTVRLARIPDQWGVRAVLTDDTIHSCSYYCDRPECIKQQRDELREQLERVTAERDELRRRIMESDKMAVADSPYGIGHNFLNGLNQPIGTYALVRLKDDEI